MHRRQALKRAAYYLGLASAPALTATAYFCQSHTLICSNRHDLGRAFSPDGELVASGCHGDGAVKLISLAWGRKGATLTGHDGEVTALAFSPDSDRLASWSTDRTIRVWDVSTGEGLAVLRGMPSNARALAFSPNGSTLAAGCEDGGLRLWDVADGSLMSVLFADSGGVISAAFSPDGKLLAAGGYDSIIRLWDAGSYKPRASINKVNMWIQDLAFSHDSKMLVSGNYAGPPILWDVAKMGPGPALQIPGWLGNTSIDYPDYVAFSPDGRTLAAGCGPTVGLWDVPTGRYLTSFGQGHRPLDLTLTSVLDSVSSLEYSGYNEIRKVVFTPAGKLLALGLSAGIPTVWSVAKIPQRGA